MVYDWEAHRETCYRLYIVEDRFLEDIMDHMREVYSFTPSKRSYQAQFRRWSFPAKKQPPEDVVVNRIKELWERNISQGEMLRILSEEDGIKVSKRQLARIRTRHRWLMRVQHAPQLSPEAVDGDSTHSPPGVHTDEEPTTDSTSPVVCSSVESSQDAEMAHFPPTITPKEQQRGRSFPSKMRMDEARAILNLGPDSYMEIRAQFREICKNEGTTAGKTVCGPEVWETVKGQLVQANTALQQVNWNDASKSSSLQFALDIICSDIAKRMRSSTVTDLKALFPLNPVQWRQIRKEFQDILMDARRAHGEAVMKAKWPELMTEWIRTSDALRGLGLSEADAAHSAQRLALDSIARDVWKRLRDEIRARQTGHSRQSRKQQQGLHGEGQLGEEQVLGSGESEPTPSPASTPTRTSIPIPMPTPIPIPAATQQPPHGRLGSTPGVETPSLSSDGGTPGTDHIHSPALSRQMSLGDDLGAGSGIFGGMAAVSVDLPPHLRMVPQSHQPPSLADTPDGLPPPHRQLRSMYAADLSLGPQAGNPLLLPPNPGNAFMDQPYVQAQYANSPAAFHPVGVETYSFPMAVFLHLHPSSVFLPGVRLWVAAMNSRSVQELRTIAARRVPGTEVLSIEGMVRHGDTALPLQIQTDQELEAYLTFNQGSAPTFRVHLI